MSIVKSTINLDKDLKDQLEILVKDGKISSLTEGINIAISDYLKKLKRTAYEKKKEEAAKDSAFMVRTMRVQEEFEGLDKDIDSGEDTW